MHHKSDIGGGFGALGCMNQTGMILWIARRCGRIAQSPFSRSENLDWAGWQGFEEGFAVALCQDAGVQNGHDPAVLTGPDQASDALSEFEDGLGQRVF